MELLATGTVIGSRYTVVQVLGQGGMAVVYEVMNHHLGTPCALKVLTITARSVRKRLEREGQVQASLSHPNVVSVFDVVEVEGSSGLLMELVRGPPLDVLLADQRLTFDQCDALARGILAGLEAAHERGLIHRDLKPANILCSVANGQLIPKIADFGLAKLVADESGAAGPSATKSGTTMGTPSYMAPEQIRNAGKVDRRADIFSVGAILYEMVCGQKAFEGEDLLDLFTAVATGKFILPRELRPDLPDRMERAILGALAVDREARIRDVSTLAAVWNGDRDEWTREFDPAAPAPIGPWDPNLLSKYRSSTSSGSGDHIISGGAMTPMAPSARGPVSGVTYHEEQAASATGKPAAVLDPSTSPRRRAAVFVSVSLAIVALTSIAVGVAFYLTVGPHLGPMLQAWSNPPEVPTPLPEPAPIATIAPQPRVEPVAEVAPLPPPTPLPTPTPNRLAPKPPPVVVESITTVVPPEPAPPEPPVPTGPATTVTVSLQGDARQVFLQGPNGNFRLPGEVPPGSYSIRVFFGDADPLENGKVTLVLGKNRTVSCTASMRTCK